MAEPTTDPNETDFTTIQPEIPFDIHKNNIEQIRARAYEIWESEGSRDGRHDDHWLQAEHEILHGDEQLDSDDLPNLAAAREAARQHTDAFIVASDLEDADQREATPGVPEQPLRVN